jgi:hypothetical protein
VSFTQNLKRAIFVAFGVIVPLVLIFPGCGSDASSSPGSGGSGTGGSGTGGSSGGTGVCLLNNCHSDAECDGCSYSRTHCDVPSTRCVACNTPGQQGSCPAGQECTSFGTCAPKGSTCPTDSSGAPTITCASNADCIACDPGHQICDTATKKCVACTATNTSLCSQSDICVDDKCAHKCPDQCTSDNDCQRCDYTDGQNVGKKAHACYNHKCSECSDTYKCAAGQICQKGQCVKPCGIGGLSAGTCNTDADCAGCGDQNSTTPYKCKYPINGGLHGTCTPQAAGCSDLGNGAVLPAPFDQVTQLCSKDGDCANIGIQYNVGQLIRDIIGGPQIDLGIKKITIQDASVTYPMHACASIKLTESVSCGVCVPCKKDSDCTPINVDTLLGDLFKGDPLAQTAGYFLIDLLYGEIKEHNLNFQCLEIAGGYGICAPCSNPIKACGNTTPTGTGTCDHKVCDTGTPLNASCDSCAAQVCANDSYCCDTNWDDLCVGEVDQYCPSGCGGTSTTTCDHDPCTSGGALNTSCSSCAATVCGYDAYCCSTSWDSTCVSEAQSDSACSSACSGGCAHSECSSGGPLDSTCSSCASDVCSGDSYCCSTSWDSTCVDEAGKSSSCSC